MTLPTLIGMLTFLVVCLFGYRIPKMCRTSIELIYQWRSWQQVNRANHCDLTKSYSDKCRYLFIHCFICLKEKLASNGQIHPHLPGMNHHPHLPGMRTLSPLSPLSPLYAPVPLTPPTTSQPWNFFMWLVPGACYRSWPLPTTYSNFPLQQIRWARRYNQLSYLGKHVTRWLIISSISKASQFKASFG